jgi:hypothetical protein
MMPGKSDENLSKGEEPPFELTDSTAVDEVAKAEKTIEVNSINKTSLIEISAIKEGVKIRTKLSPDAVTRIASAYQSKAAIPPVTLQKDSNKLVDGNTRIAALKLLGKTEVEVTYIDIDDNDLYAKALELNKAHGQQLTKAEQNEAIYKLRHDEQRTWDDIGRIIGLSAGTVHQRYTEEISIRGIEDPYDGRRVVSDRKVIDLIELGWTQGAIAIHLGISQPRVSQIVARTHKYQKVKPISTWSRRKNSDILPKNLQINMLKKRFRKCNTPHPPHLDPDEIVWEDHVDPKCTFEENKYNLAEAYPDWDWEVNQPQRRLELDDNYPAKAKLYRYPNRVFYKVSIPKNVLEHLNSRLLPEFFFNIPLRPVVDKQEVEQISEDIDKFEDHVFDSGERDSEWLMKNHGSTPEK